MKRGGIISQQKGAKSENKFEVICNYLFNLGIAEIQKNATTMRKNRQGDYFYARKTKVDFTGYRFLDGKHIAFELKHKKNLNNFTTDKRIHQLKYLARVQASSGIAYFVVEVNGVYYLFAPFWDINVDKSQKINFEKADIIISDINPIEGFKKLIESYPK